MWRLSGRGVPLEHQADRTERVLFFGSANTISTTSRDLRKSIRGERKQGWSRNDNAHCRAVYWAQSFIFRACISVFCPRLFMLLSSRLLASASPPGNLAGFSSVSRFLWLASLTQQTPGISPQVVSERLHHRRHRCHSHYHQQTSLAGEVAAPPTRNIFTHSFKNSPAPWEQSKARGC